LVAREYATESGLERRREAYRHAEGPDPRELAFRAVAEAAPGRVLEVGPGPGEFAARVRQELGAEVVAIDISPRMVDLARARGVDARIGDVQELPFADGEFDCAVAAWMLYHVPDLERGLAELARVLRPGGRLVAVTNGLDHMRELAELLGVPPMMRATGFGCENATEVLSRHFARVERRDASGSVVFPDRAAAQAYVDATSRLSQGGRQLPAFEGRLRIRSAPCVLVADTAA